MVVEFNKIQTLMIHSYQSKILLGDNSSINIDTILHKDKNGLVRFSDKFNDKLNLEETIITFDDGLVQQIEVIKLFGHKHQVIFFPSFGLIRPDNILPNPIENSMAHSNKLLYLSTFMSSAEIWDLVHLKYKLGMHGWYHLNLNLNHDIDKLTTLEKLRSIKDDAKKCVEEYYKYLKPVLEDYIIDGILTLYFCTPYNCMNELQKIYIEFLVVFIQKTFTINIPKKLIIFSHERISIENFIKDIHNAIM